MNSPATTDPADATSSPLETLLGKLVHDMSDEELADFIKHMAVLRSSAQTRNAAIKASSEPKEKKVREKKGKTDDAASKAAMDKLNKLLGL